MDKFCAPVNRITQNRLHFWWLLVFSQISLPVIIGLWLLVIITSGPLSAVGSPQKSSPMVALQRRTELMAQAFGFLPVNELLLKSSPMVALQRRTELMAQAF